MKKARLVSIVLSALMVFYAFPLHGFAVNAGVSESIPSNENIIEEFVPELSEDESSDLSEEDAEPMILYEDKKLRTEDTKHYRMTDGSFTAVKFDNDVHYEKDGEWKEIDNSLVLDPSSTKDKPVYRNFAGNVLFRFEGDPTDGKVSAEYEDYEISFELIDLPEPDVGLQPVPNPGDQVELMANENAESEETAAEIIIDEIPASEPEESTAEESELQVESETEASETKIEDPVEETTGLDTEAVSEPETIASESSETLESSEPIESDTAETTTAIPDTTVVPETTEPESTEISDSMASINPEINEKLPVLQERSFEIEIINPGKEKTEIMTLAEATEESKATDKQEEFTTFTLNQAFESVKSSSLINFTAPADDFTLSYNLTGNTLKENIIVNNKSSEYTYKFALNTVGLVPALTEDGSVSLNNADGELIFTIPTPYMFDAENEYSENVSYAVTGNAATGYVITITADPEWINAEERAMPVIIDPALVLTKYASTSNDDIDTQYYSVGGGLRSATGNMYLGYDSSGDLAYSGYFKVNNLPTLPDNCVPIHAQIVMYQNAYSAVGLTSFKVSAHRVTSNTTSAPWYNNYDVNALDYITITDLTQAGYCNTLSWEITAAAQDWYEGTSENLGIVFRNVKQDMSSSSCAKATLVGYNNAGYYADAQPKFVVSYLHTVGLESRYEYITQSVGRAGTGNIRVNDSEFTLVKTDLTNSGSAMPFTLSHIYNGAYSNKQFTKATGVNTLDYSQMKVGIGWKLSVQQTIVQTTIKDINGNDVTYHIYTDEDGTEHYFYNDPSDNEENEKQGKEDNVYIDEEGMNLTLTVSNGISELKNDKDDKYTFVNGYLYKIEDADQNLIQINYSNASGGSLSNKAPSASYNRIVSITQTVKGESAKTIATFTYTNGNLSSVTDEAGRATRYYYGGIGNLYNITHSDNSAARYVYDGLNYRMTRAFDSSTGYGIDYKYYTNAPGIYNFQEFAASYSSSGVITVSETGAKYYIGTSGKDITYVRYVGNDRVSMTADDIVTAYMFDDEGRTVNSYSANCKPGDTYAPFKIYGTSVIEYTPTGTTPSKKDNKISADALTGTLPLNYLSDPGAERSAAGWSYGETVGIAYTDDNDVRTGNRSFVLDNYYGPASGSNTSIYQTLYLTPGTYTFSAYVKMTDLSETTTGGGALLQAVYGTNVIAQSRKITQNSNTDVEDGWERLTLTFTASAAGYYAVYASLVGAAGIVYVDDAQLEPNDGASRINLIENGRAESNTKWTATSGSYTLGSLAHSGNTSISVTPGIEGSAQITNTVNINAEQGSESFVLGGWANAHSVPEKEDDSVKFKLYAKLNYSDGTADFKDIKFNTDIRGEWQYGSRVLVSKADKTLVSVDVVCYYAANNGTAYFDDISLIHESVQTYKYNDDGELVSTTSSDKKTADTYQYDGADLIESNVPGSGKFTYEYNETGINKHLVTKVTNDTVSSNITYDAAGNTVGTNLTGTTTNLQLSTSATYYAANISADAPGFVGKNYLYQTTDANGLTTTYQYYNAKDENTKLLSTITTPVSDTGVESSSTVNTRFVYDDSDRIGTTYISSKIALNYTYTNGALSQIRRAGYYNGVAEDQFYKYTYDAWGNMTSNKVGNRTINTYTFGANNGRLTSMTYPNGVSVSYTYDNLDRVTVISYNGTVRYRYRYNGDGAVALSEDIQNGFTTYYEYDGIGRLIAQMTYKNNALVEGERYDYDDCARTSKVNSFNALHSQTSTFSYNDNDGTLSDITGKTSNNTNYTLSYTYDGLKRLQKKTLQYSSLKSLRTDYKYESLTDTKTTTRVNDLRYVVNNSSSYFRRYNYEYDSAGNISQTTTGQGENAVRYFYDKQNQLVLEMNPYSNQTYQYVYDGAGNIRSKKVYTGSFDDYADFTANAAYALTDTINYTYGDTNDCDRLTAYDGHAITYDALGNPTQYYGACGSVGIIWDDANKLGYIVGDDYDAEYAYNADGQRISKTVEQEDEHKYYYSGGKLITESWGNKSLEFLYDDSGMYGFVYHNGSNSSPYFFIKNMQGDVVELVNSTMTTVAKYAYDAWGNLLWIKNSAGTVITSSTHIANINPIRYRGYYYDTETGFYYLGSRYYDPTVGRFINADNIDVVTADLQTTTDKNLYAYCDNNPVSRVDDGGEFWNFVVGAVVGAAVGAITQVVSNVAQGKDWKDGLVTATLSGAVNGLVGASGLCVVKQAVIGGAINGVSNIVNKGKSIKNWTAGDYLDLGCDVVIGVASSFLSYKATKSSGDMADKIVKKGVNKVVRGEQTLLSGNRYARGTIRRGTEILNKGIFKANVVKGTSSVISSAIGGTACMGKTFLFQQGRVR